MPTTSAATHGKFDQLLDSTVAELIAMSGADALAVTGKTEAEALAEGASIADAARKEANRRGEAGKMVLHLKTQRDQPYGSVRKCCERCGIMIYGPSDIHWTDEPATYDSPPPQYVRCEDNAA